MGGWLEAIRSELWRLQSAFVIVGREQMEIVWKLKWTKNDMHMDDESEWKIKLSECGVHYRFIHSNFHSSNSNSFVIRFVGNCYTFRSLWNRWRTHWLIGFENEAVFLPPPRSSLEWGEIKGRWKIKNNMYWTGMPTNKVIIVCLLIAGEKNQNHKKDKIVDALNSTKRIHGKFVATILKVNAE